MLLGCIGDDFTGSSDLANTLVKGGMATTLYSGVPTGRAEEGVEAAVVALKTRSLPVEEAVAQSLDAMRWLQQQGCMQFLFKYCSTFDSTPQGNIGPVALALADALSARRVVFCPAFPGAGRSLYQGHLFVNDRLLNESGMESHPLTPMTDPDIRRWLQRQTSASVGHVGFSDVRGGGCVIWQALAREEEHGHRFIVVDALSDDDLYAIGEAVADQPLVTGGSGIALGLPENFRRKGLIGHRRVNFEPTEGPGLILSGSCSNATRGQVGVYRIDHPALEIEADALMSGEMTADLAISWIKEHLGKEPLVYSSANPDKVRDAQAKYGTEVIAEKIEDFFAQIAAAAREIGITRLVSAGGETSGAVVKGLGCTAMDVGPEIAPGVPALRLAGENFALTLKSGNFGTEDFFVRALRTMANGR
ncbi:3-oxo-tetronate kinase [Aquamicrobium zhengzhouense]|uniref:3-oxo-tetronate kinase n=1 Tax=Aquamicrobium zhengzhouense TaxID=2781738 RepID=A0ABS0SEH3_9HYPH|nr:3-oxo-tetronate kinase [Aquamicrobium zhengzhouense]MBI1621693.1 four-carbon acid sugar kinase family protein [Aquamicrobium zhengzhouense]